MKFSRENGPHAPWHEACEGGSVPIRPGSSPLFLVLLAGACALSASALTACAKSDPIGGAGGSGSGGWDPVEDDTSGAEAGPEAGSGAGLPSGAGGEDGDPPSSSGSTTQGSTGSGELCGDGTCQVDLESCETCPGDCGGPCAGSCGDGACDAAGGEACDTCAPDCGACASCGDGTCDEPAESCESCASDCGVCQCEPDDLEPNGGSGSASPLALNVEVDGLSICAGDVDWFEFTVSGTRTVTASFLHASGDLELEIFSEATSQYVTGSYSEDDGEVVVLSGQPAGTYWARVYGAASETNWSYSIVVEN